MFIECAPFLCFLSLLSNDIGSRAYTRGTHQYRHTFRVHISQVLFIKRRFDNAGRHSHHAEKALCGKSELAPDLFLKSGVVDGVSVVLIVDTAHVQHVARHFAHATTIEIHKLHRHVYRTAIASCTLYGQTEMFIAPFNRRN